MQGQICSGTGKPEPIHEEFGPVFALQPCVHRMLHGKHASYRLSVANTISSTQL